MNAASSSTLHEWASFLSVLNRNPKNGTPLIDAGHDPYRMINHLERRFPMVRKYRKGKQLSLFAN